MGQNNTSCLQAVSTPGPVPPCPPFHSPLFKCCFVVTVLFCLFVVGGGGVGGGGCLCVFVTGC